MGSQFPQLLGLVLFYFILLFITVSMPVSAEWLDSDESTV